MFTKKSGASSLLGKRLLPVNFSKFLHGSNVTFISACKYSDVRTNNFLANRNPRNLERLTIARKPTGYHLDKPGKLFWHKVVLEQKPRNVIAKVYHNNGSTVIQASTNEWGITKHLFRTNHTSSYICLAQVLATRCLECGIYYMVNGIVTNSIKKQTFVEHLEENGVTLSEPPTYTPLTPWSLKIYEKPWKIHID